MSKSIINPVNEDFFETVSQRLPELSLEELELLQTRVHQHLDEIKTKAADNSEVKNAVLYDTPENVDQAIKATFGDHKDIETIKNKIQETF